MRTSPRYARNRLHCGLYPLVPAALTAALSLVMLLPKTSGQSVSGQVAGVVADSQGLAVVGATVELTSSLSGQVRQFQTGPTGAFIFPNIVAGQYDLRITQPGFKVYNQKDIRVGVQESVDLHTIALTVGEVTTSVDVAAEAAHVATDSSDRSVSLNTRQIVDLPTIGRNYTDVLKGLPGTQVTTLGDSRGWNTTTPAVNGGQVATLVTLDGVVSQDSGTFTMSGYIQPSIDAIGEVTVLVSNYNAEYGSRTGAQISYSTKNGTREFHGTLYDYWRHESLNANGFINNMNGLSRPRYRYMNPGGTIGGPLVIPGTNFNRSRNRLFFFFSDDYLHNQAISAVSQFTMPTALERAGDFSQTFTSAGVLIPVIDPTTGKPFPGNVIPASRINPTGAALMNLFPLPNSFDRTGLRQYNSQYQPVLDKPRHDKILRVDYGIGPRTNSFVRLIQDDFGSKGYGSTLAPLGGVWGQYKTQYTLPAAGAALTVIHTFQPNLINEFSAGLMRSHQILTANDPDFAKSQLPLTGANGQTLPLPSAFAGPAYLNLLPAIYFASSNAASVGQAVTNPPSFGPGSRYPFEGTDTNYNVSNNLTWVKGPHSLKAGVYLEFEARGTPVYYTFGPDGSYYFGTDTQNPYDTGYPFSNLLMGTVQAYGQDNQRIIALGRYRHYEWFVQDSWRLSRRLHLEFGMRFQDLVPFYAKGATVGAFQATNYDPGKAGQLLFPALVNGTSVALNPATGATYAYGRSGSFDPASYPTGGSPFSGMAQYNGVFFQSPGVEFDPRLGFSYDVFGNGKMAIRGGFGVFHGNAYPVDTIANMTHTPPNFKSPEYFNATFSTLQNATGFYTPQDVYSGDQSNKSPSTYNWSFGIQREVGNGLILDVAYVGNVAHHQGASNATVPSVDINAVRPLTTWNPNTGVNPAFVNPTTKATTGALYSPNLIRALAGGYYGYGAINYLMFVGESLYDGLQLQINRRFGKRLQFAANWTWSKTITYQRLAFVDDQLLKNVVNRPHAVNITFGYQLPDGTRLLGTKSAVAKALFNGWNINGIGSYFMGTPMTVGCTATNVPANLGNYWTGTPNASVGMPFWCQMTGSMWLPNGTTPSSVGSNANPRVWYPFNAKDFVLPPPTSLGIGNTPQTLTYGPGFENWDLSVSKAFQLGRETNRILELRMETFNTFNHFNPGNPNTSLTYNFATGAQTNGAFGSITTAQNNPRYLSLSARIRF